MVLLSLLIPAGPATGSVPAWTTYRHDAARTGIDPDSVIPTSSALAWQTSAGALDGTIFAQPLVYGSRVFVATENDTVYALDAAAGTVLWSTHLATPESAQGPNAPTCGDISPTVGITGTPVIDPSANRIYAVAAIDSPSGVQHQLFALDLNSGTVAAGFPVRVDPPAGAPAYLLQRTALTLQSQRVLVGFGGNSGDCGNYHGWLVSARTDGSHSLLSFEADPGHAGGAIWGSGTGPAVDADNHLWLATGYGFSGSTFDFGESVIELNSAMNRLAFWAPVNWNALDTSDQDLGSSEPLLLPDNLLFQSGKDGNGYLINRSSPGGISAPVSQVSFCPDTSFGGGVYSAANATIYAACTQGVKALTLDTSGATPSLSLRPGFSAPSDAIGPPMMAGGLVWVTAWNTVKLYGLDPSTGHAVVQYALPGIEHFAAPSAGGGRLFVGAGRQVDALTIAPGTTAPVATTTATHSSSNPSYAGAAVTYRAAVAPSPDSGAVAFTDNGSAIPGCGAVPLSGASASCQAMYSLAGSHQVRSEYLGDSRFEASGSAPLRQTVRAALPAPKVAAASIRPRSFTAQRGATLRVQLSEAATLTVTISQLVTVHGHRCPRHHRTCRLSLRRARHMLNGRAGSNRFRLGVTRLRPGAYTATVVASAAGRKSLPVRLMFTIAKPR
jgi:outer membrane protein assembly factor BamB